MAFFKMHRPQQTTGYAAIFVVAISLLKTVACPGFAYEPVHTLPEVLPEETRSDDFRIPSPVAPENPQSRLYFSPGTGYFDTDQQNTETLSPAGLPRLLMMLNGELFDLEVADTVETKVRGLMFRDHLPAHQGMIFGFKPEREVNFWMKNCKIPLDMLFISKRQVVNIRHSAPPCIQDPCPSFHSMFPVDMVVELPGGTAKHYGVEPGDRILLMRPDDPQVQTMQKSYPQFQSPSVFPLPEEIQPFPWHSSPTEKPEIDIRR